MSDDTERVLVRATPKVRANPDYGGLLILAIRRAYVKPDTWNDPADEETFIWAFPPSPLARAFRAFAEEVEAT